MNNSLPLQKFSTAAILALVGLMFVSCGSYQQASYYDNDGIYADSDDRIAERPTTNKTTPKQKEENTYSRYFGSKADQYEEILEGEIFTEIDSYSSDVENDSITENQLTDYYKPENDYQGYAGWGDNATDVNINIYESAGFGFYNPWFNTWGWNNWGWGGAWGWNGGWGWNNPWRWNRWGGWGGYYGGWGYAGYYGGWGWNNWGWGGYNAWCPPYAYGYGNYSRYAVNRSRRGYYNTNAIAGVNSRNALRGRSNVNTRGNSSRYRSTSSRSLNSRSTNVRSSRTGVASRRSVGVDQNRAYRTSRSTRAVPRYNSSSRSSQSYRSTTPRSGTYRSGRSSSGVRTAPRTSGYTRSSGTRAGSYRSSGSSSRTNQSYRSSTPRSSSYRSSGSRSSGARSSGYRSSGSSSRSSGGSYRSSGGSSSRSSGSVRSSGGSSRSSGARSSGSRGGGRRQ